jgi:chromosome segregation and condensation protein ScpB
MSPGPRLVLKQSTGWFAAGWTFADAMTALSDLAFKLFAWLCLNADRHTGRIRITALEIAQALGKSNDEIQAACDELVERGVCRRGMDLELEIADTYWPYEKQSCESGPQAYVAQVRKLLSEPACVRCRFSAADEKLARDLYQRGVSLAQVEHAIRLGCARKYATLLSNPAAAMPIASLRYFMTIIEEVVHDSNTSDTYWAHIRRKAITLEREWMSRSSSRTGLAGG